MPQAVQSLLHVGAGGIIIEVECHISNGLPAIIVVGLGNKAVDEAKERIRSAYASCKLTLPAKRITINLAPADVPKDSTSFDLAIAVAILQAAKQTKRPIAKHEAIIGEVGLDGHIRPVRGIIGKLLAGKGSGITTFYVPQANLEQALLVPNITIVAITNLRDLYLDLCETVSLKRYESGAGILPAATAASQASHQMCDVVGQEAAKRALEIAAAGGHNVLLSGPPGTGKSMLAKALANILPPLSQDEMLEITHLHSLASNNYDRLVTDRPFRSPHHSASSVSIMGGGNTVRPGEISLSHCGVLFLDELPEFGRSTIEALRQPLEDGIITIARAKESVAYPASFILVATANPCPCGYYGSAQPCSCSPSAIIRYKQRISGPILDRIDLFVTVETVEHKRLLQNSSYTSDAAVQKRVLRARAMQQKRYKDRGVANAAMTNEDIRSLAHITGEAQELLNRAAQQLNLSARSYMRTAKVARTIADLENSTSVEADHISEALQYRNHGVSVVE